MKSGPGPHGRRFVGRFDVFFPACLRIFAFLRPFCGRLPVPSCLGEFAVSFVPKIGSTTKKNEIFGSFESRSRGDFGASFLTHSYLGVLWEDGFSGKLKKLRR